jgi:gliding motility-associated-like protein
LTVTDSNGCTDDVCTDAVVYPALSAQFDVTNTTCGANNGAINTSVTGGSGSAIYFWTGPGVVAANEDQVNLPGGAYDVVISDTNSGCQIEEELNVGTTVAPTLATTVQGASCFGGNNGSVLATVTNASFPLSFTWTDAGGNTIGETEFVDDLIAGVYTITWLDGAGCTDSEDVSVGQADAIAIDAEIPLYNNGFNVSGFGASDGAIDVEVSGGTPQYTFDWTHIEGTGNPESLSGLAAGDYTLTVTDAAGCRVDSVFTVTEPSELELLNGLTPNNDGFNDAYLIRGLSPNKGAELKVFNRWGNLVYEQSNYYDQWKGQNSDGDELAAGTYFVVFKLGNRELSTYVDLRR